MLRLLSEGFSMQEAAQRKQVSVSPPCSVEAEWVAVGASRLWPLTTALTACQTLERNAREPVTQNPLKLNLRCALRERASLL